MFEAMTHFNLDAFTHLFSEGEVMGPFSRPSVSQSYVLPCADGKWIALHMSSPPKFWQGLAQAIEKPDLFDDPRFADARGAHRAPGDADRVADRPVPRARARRVVPPAGGAGRAAMRRCTTPTRCPRIRRPGTCNSSSMPPHPAHPEGERWRTVRSPVSFDGERALEVTAPPLLGDHDEVLRSGASPWARASPDDRRSGAAAPS